jgi:LysM repeat protein
VQSGDTLSAVASALAVPGGWQALYAANKRAIGPNPNLIHPGTILVLPGRAAPARYTVQAGDTLSGIAAALGLSGWQLLYVANKRAIGPNPDVIQPGMVLVAPHPAARAPSPPGAPKPPASPTHQHKPAPPAPSASATPSASVTTTSTANPAKPVPGTQPVTGTQGRGAQRRETSGSAGMPPWLGIMLLAVALLIGAAFLAEPVLAIGRRRRAAALARRRMSAHAGQELDAGHLAAERTRIILAKHDRLIVTYSQQDDTVYVLTPPGEDPRAVLRAARLILPEDTYQELAGHLGIHPSWPME